MCLLILSLKIHKEHWGRVLLLSWPELALAGGGLFLRTPRPLGTADARPPVFWSSVPPLGPHVSKAGLSPGKTKGGKERKKRTSEEVAHQNWKRRKRKTKEYHVWSVPYRWHGVCFFNVILDFYRRSVNFLFACEWRTHWSGEKVLAKHWLFVQWRIFVDICVTKVRLQLCLGTCFLLTSESVCLRFPHACRYTLIKTALECF